MKIFLFVGLCYLVVETQGFLFGGSSCGCAPRPACPPPPPCAKAKAAKTETKVESQKVLDELELVSHTPMMKIIESFREPNLPDSTSMILLQYLRFHKTNSSTLKR